MPAHVGFEKSCVEFYACWAYHAYVHVFICAPTPSKVFKAASTFLATQVFMKLNQTISKLCNLVLSTELIA